MDLWQQPAHGLKKLLSKVEISARELMAAHLERLREVEPLVQSFITLTEETALEQAAQMNQRRETKEELHPWRVSPGPKGQLLCPGPSHNLWIEDVRNYTAIYDATVYRRLRRPKGGTVGENQYG